MKADKPISRRRVGGDEMKLKELMKQPVVTIAAGTCIAQAAKEMVKAGIGFLPIMDHGRISGVVTGKDLATRGAARGLGMDSVPVSVIMSFPPICLSGEEDAYTGLNLMRERGIRRILVSDGSGQVIGVISLADLESGITETIISSLRRAEDRRRLPSDQERALVIPGLYLG